MGKMLPIRDDLISWGVESLPTLGRQTTMTGGRARCRE
jgi:hypothetical protein